MSKNTGGFAFPKAIDSHYTASSERGMTLRQYYAGQAMQALIASRHTDYEDGFYDELTLAESAYKMADAMLEAEKL